MKIQDSNVKSNATDSGRCSRNVGSERANRSNYCDNGQRRRRLPLLALLVAGATVLAACGSSSTAVSTSKTTSPTTSASSTVNTAGLAAKLKAMEALPIFKAPGPPILASKLAGKTIVVIDANPAASPVVQATNGVISAAKVAGLKAKLLNGQNDNSSLYSQLLDQAIAAKPMAIVAVAITPALAKVQLQAAKSAGIPVIVGLSGWHANPAQPDYYGFVTQPGPAEGLAMAEQIAVTGPKNAQIGFITSNIITLSKQIFDSFKVGLAKYCPGCKIVDTQNVDPANWVSSLPSTTSSILASHPKLNYFIPVFDGMTPFIVSSLGAGGHKVSILTTQGSVGGAIKLVKNGTFTSDVGPSSIWLGWALVDQALRAGLKLPPESDTNLPIRLLTASDLTGTQSNSDAAVYGTSYVQGFKKLWGLG